MAVGAGGVALSYLLLAAVAAFSGGAVVAEGWIWLVIFFVVMTAGELYILPIGLGLFGRLASERIHRHDHRAVVSRRILRQSARRRVRHAVEQLVAATVLRSDSGDCSVVRRVAAGVQSAGANRRKGIRMSIRLLSVAVAALAVCNAFADAPRPDPVPLTAADAAAFLDGMLPSGMAMGDIAGATVAIVKDDAVLLTRGIWVRRRRKAHSGFRRTDAVPPCFDLEAVHVDGGHAAGRSGQARPRWRHQRLPRFQDRRLRRSTDQTASPADAHGRLRRIAARPAGRGRRQGEAARRSAQGRHPRANLSAGHGARVLQLRRIARRLHRCACRWHAVRAVRGGTDLQAAADGAFDVPTAGTGVAA